MGKRKRRNRRKTKTVVVYRPQTTRFKTDAEKLFEEIGDIFNLNKSLKTYGKAQRWKDNYLKAFNEKIIGGLESVYADEETIQAAKETYNKLKNSDVLAFLSGQWTFPEELSISDVYPPFEREMRAKRTIELWQQFLQ